MIDNESSEMYLETILILSNKMEVVRPVDIAKELKYSRASVSRGLSLLREEGFIKDEKPNVVELTLKGKTKANRVFERHQVLSQFLISLGVGEKNAVQDACKIEHILSDETFNQIKKITKQ